jgi:hypothetical protein
MLTPLSLLAGFVNSNCKIKFIYVELRVKKHVRIIKMFIKVALNIYVSIINGAPCLSIVLTMIRHRAPSSTPALFFYNSFSFQSSEPAGAHRTFEQRSVTAPRALFFYSLCCCLIEQSGWRTPEMRLVFLKGPLRHLNASQQNNIFVTEL